MRITQVDTHLLRLPLTRPVALAAGQEPWARRDHLVVLVVYLETNSGRRGVGLAPALRGGGRALKTIVDDDLAPLVTQEDPLDHERLATKAASQLREFARAGLVAEAYSAIDLALWDLKGKVAGLPVHKLLGGARESAPAYAADVGWLSMGPDEIVEAARSYLDGGISGIKMQVGGPSPEADADRVTRVREALGEDVWFGVDGGERYDYATALSMGHFFEEEMGVDWFEDPVPADDVDAHARLADKLEVPIAVGSSLSTPGDFRRYLESRCRRRAAT
jgi:L-alanine-DL-glutamate epimerase-like enolase superfamily enzyme